MSPIYLLDIRLNFYIVVNFHDYSIIDIDSIPVLKMYNGHFSLGLK